MKLDIVSYNNAEYLGSRELANDQIRACSSVTFSSLGYPHSVKEEIELTRYVDTMHEFSGTPEFFKNAKYSETEAAMVNLICDAAQKVVRNRFEKNIRPCVAPLTTIKMARAVNLISLIRGGKPLRVLEIGGGSGYLGAWLMAMGHQYYCTDIAQAFYLWQNMLMEEICQDDFVEGALEKNQDYIHSNKRAIHIPWWDYIDLYRKDLPEFDIIISDHALGEMSQFALRYVLSIASKSLKNSPVGIFMFESPGEEKQNSYEGIISIASIFGLSLFQAVDWRRGQISCFCHQGKRQPMLIHSLADTIPYIGGGQIVTPAQFMRIKKEEIPLSYSFFSQIGFAIPPISE